MIDIEKDAKLFKTAVRTLDQLRMRCGGVSKFEKDLKEESEEYIQKIEVEIENFKKAAQKWEEYYELPPSSVFDLIRHLKSPDYWSYIGEDQEKCKKDIDQLKLDMLQEFAEEDELRFSEIK